MDFLMKDSTSMHNMLELKEYFPQMASYILQMLTTLDRTKIHLKSNSVVKV